MWLWSIITSSGAFFLCIAIFPREASMLDTVHASSLPKIVFLSELSMDEKTRFELGSINQRTSKKKYRKSRDNFVHEAISKLYPSSGWRKMFLKGDDRFFSSRFNEFRTNESYWVAKSVISNSNPSSIRFCCVFSQTNANIMKKRRESRIRGIGFWVWLADREHASDDQVDRLMGTRKQ